MFSHYTKIPHKMYIIHYIIRFHIIQKCFRNPFAFVDMLIDLKSRSSINRNIARITFVMICDTLYCILV